MNKYKIGDRIKVVKFHDEEFIGHLATVLEGPSSRWAVLVRWDIPIMQSCPDCPLREDEIELVNKEEQLLFSFMKDIERKES